MPDVRPPTGGQFALEILGTIAGALKKFDGLGMEAEVVTNNLGPRNIQKKHVTKFKWTPARSMIGIGMGREMSTLIQQAFQAQQKPFDGALHLANASGKILAKFMPGALEANSDKVARFSCEFYVEEMEFTLK